MTATPRPDFIPAGATAMPFSELAVRHDEIKPKTRSRVRMCFPYLRFTPNGEIKDISAGDAAVTILQGRLHPKTYMFDGTDPRLSTETICWVWTLDDERAEQVQMAA